jgi:copper(I)-binding protein
MSRRPVTVLALPVLIAAMAVLSACAGGATTSPGTADGPSASDAWVRPPMGPDRPGAAYLTLSGGTTDDRLIGVQTDAAEHVELHRTTAGESGMMGMEPVDAIDVPASTTVKLEPGGLHLMLFGLQAEPGDEVELRLTFASGAELSVPATVRAG